MRLYTSHRVARGLRSVWGDVWRHSISTPPIRRTTLAPWRLHMSITSRTKVMLSFDPLLAVDVYPPDIASIRGNRRLNLMGPWIGSSMGQARSLTYLVPLIKALSGWVD
ncbi:hypothetical protein N7510_005001 [Penicillium lagena]|uniref:uncharacterized protein n=1 Tax=Penicillium lagena TaxID=94218 RepID=UPI002540E9C2|nr:uncharacterized protein N7510_005001 [Penicillium lagena]KAJ5621017.1 hypothetical protein N7510_005001 [Penicillium lagena]